MTKPSSEPSAIDQALLAFIRNQFLYDRAEVALTPESHLFQEAIVDSVGILQLVGFIESSFGVSLRPDDLVLKNFESIAAIRALVLDRL